MNEGKSTPSSATQNSATQNSATQNSAIRSKYQTPELEALGPMGGLIGLPQGGGSVIELMPNFYGQE
jgi:hypothetical protein